ncbi:pyruvate, phosphate dikinase [Mariniblastus sp.]|nr:pyruvate, phosphate dikinase [Mariniblastus sp.]
MAKKYVYFYGGGKQMTDGDRSMRELLGGKGANLAEMSNAGVPVPPGFTVSTEACGIYEKLGAYPKEMMQQVKKELAKLEKLEGKKLGAAKDPLLVSVRSGAAQSMPGMMDTVLNLGMNDKSVKGFIDVTGNARAGWDCYRRFIDMFGDVVMGPSSTLEHHHFEEALTSIKKKYKAKQDTDLTAEQLEELVGDYKKIYKKHVKEDFPQDPMKQLEYSINAVFDSWQTERAVKYRILNKITGLIGTAVNVQTMVFGNMGDDCATGVAFTRDGSTGEAKPMGEYLVNAQGEDVVAGIRTPQNLDDLANESDKGLVKAGAQLLKTMKMLEKHYKYPQDVEFTIQQGKLYMLQTRNAKRVGIAGVRWAVEMATGKDVVTGEKQPKLLNPKTALLTVTGSDLEQLLFPIFDAKEEAKKTPFVTGLPAGPGAAYGEIVFDSRKAEEIKKKHPEKNLILVRHETSPEDVGGMGAAAGILTSTGGMTSHAAVVARGWGKCCICGAGDLKIDYKKGTVSVGGKTFKAGDKISLNGSTGKVYEGEIANESSPVVAGLVEGNKKAQKHWIFQMYQTVSEWSDKYRKINVRTNADSPADSAAAIAFGAEGIGLCRTEHMFFEGDRITDVRRFILAETDKDRNAAIKKLLPHQRKDFEGIFKAMNGKPVTVRLLDPPLHEFLPHTEADMKKMAKEIGVPLAKIKERVAALHEFNPMLGHRGCRLSITFPILCEMQTQAIIEAACKMTKKGVKVLPEIMIPLIGTKAELDYLEKIVRRVADAIIAKQGCDVTYLVGTMIEIPRAALTADKVAESAEFFSFGTNDLTQMTFGYSRDDIGTFLPDYLEKKMLDVDPFAQIDESGVGQLVEMAVQKGRQTRPSLKCGICGEHGGEPSSVKFCVRAGLNYVSCSPYRVPIARLAAAQAAIEG